jgi:hypothetical protein
MRLLKIPIALAGLLPLAHAAPMGGELRVLQPVPRHEWDSTVRARQTTLPANVTLSDSGEMLWRGHGKFSFHVRDQYPSNFGPQ